MNTNHQELEAKKSFSFGRFLLGAILIFSYPVGTFVMAQQGGDDLVLEKVLTRWLLPPGILALASIAVLVAALLKGQRFLFLVGLAAVLVCSTMTDPVAKVIVSSLEDRYDDVANGKLEAMDYLVVLGGASGLTTSGRPQLVGGGERIALAARIYHAGLAKKIVVTGDSLLQYDAEFDSPQKQAVYLLTGLGVPADAISTLNGRNTAQEIASLKAQPKLWQGKRCGLMTSAFHLPRAMSLADRAEVDVIPIPADYVQPNGPASPLTYIPNADNFLFVSRSVQEYMGMAVGR